MREVDLDRLTYFCMMAFSSLWMARMASRPISFIAFFAATWLAMDVARADIRINEFMSSNNRTLLDDFSEASDWIELHNTGSAPVNLLGWTLTDRADRPSMWVFPSRILEGGGYLVVFASGRNRKVPNEPLHTSFSLSANGEYLGLFRPDGTIASEFAPTFPPQGRDISYGIPQHLTRVVIAQGAAAQVGVPLTQEDYDVQFSGWNHQMDPMQGNRWKTVRTGIGYDLTGDPGLYSAWIGPGGDLREQMHARNASCFLRLSFDVQQPESLLFLRLRMRWDDGFIAYVNGVQVATSDAPQNTGWDSAATSERIDEANEEWTDWILSPSAVPLRAGSNLLAIHGLNHSDTDPSFLVLPHLETIEPAPDPAPAYFKEPTPGKANGPGDTMGPLLHDPTDTLPRPLGHVASPARPVTVHVLPTTQPVDPSSVHVLYRTQFGLEVRVPMRDDGQAPDEVAGDGVYSALLPTAGPGAGQMLRWRFEASDLGGTRSHVPLYEDPENSDRYFGTVAENGAEATSQLPIVHLFIEDTTAAATLAGTRASVFYLDRFYDNIHINLHGQSSRGFPKKSHNLDFNRGNRFTWSDSSARKVKDLDLLSNYADKTRVRNTLAHEVARQTGAAHHFAFPVRVQRNGTFHGVMDMVENSDEQMLERNQLDPEGALYKMYNDMSSTYRARKKTRRHEDESDLVDLINTLDPGRPLSVRHTAAYDILDLPATINYLVTRQLNSDRDHGHKNYLLYRDTNRTGEWQPIIWDVDLSWGHNWTETFHYFDDTLYFDNPLDAHAGDNRLYYLIYAFPELRAMFVRRMRTVMDSILQPPGTTDGHLESFMQQLMATIDPDPAEPSPWTDGDLDFLKWGTWGRGLRPRPELDHVITQYLQPRRAFLFNTDPATRPRLPRNTGSPIPDHPQINVQGMIAFDRVEALPVSALPAEQYLTLRNQTSQAVDISGWTLHGAITHTFPGGTVIPAGLGTAAVDYRGLLHVVKDAIAFRSRNSGPTGGQRRLVQGNFAGYLSPYGGSLHLHDERGVLITSVTYEGQPTPWREFLRISELHYHPAEPSTAELEALSWMGANDYEFIEFVNRGETPLPLGGVAFTRGIRFLFPSMELGPQERLILAKDPDAFAHRYPLVPAARVLGPYEGLLDNSGERLLLADPFGVPILEFDYHDHWYPATDGAGHSLVLRDPQGISWDEFGRAASWAISLLPGGSPGEADVAFAQAYRGWDNGYFTETELDLPLIAGAGADPDEDGHPNWVEYAFGLNPGVPDQPRMELKWIELDGRVHLALQFQRASNALDLSFELLATDQLQTHPDDWATVATEAYAVHPLDPFKERALYLDPQPIMSNGRFLRIRATYNP
jgi:hypothetical protein